LTTTRSGWYFIKEVQPIYKQNANDIFEMQDNIGHFTSH